jgi:hypothetical protein
MPIKALLNRLDPVIAEPEMVRDFVDDDIAHETLRAVIGVPT